MTAVEAFHGTSTRVLARLHAGEPLRSPYLARNAELADYYAEQQAEDDGGDPVVLVIKVEDKSRLRYDGAAMDEPVLVSDDQRDAAWEQSEHEHPEWVSDRGYLLIPEGAWTVSWDGAHSARYEGDIPATHVS